MSTSNPASRAPSAPVTGWSVTSQEHVTDVDGQGRASRGWRVHFVTGGGVNGSVFVVEARYTPESVRAAIAAAAALVDQVQNLKG